MRRSVFGITGVLVYLLTALPSAAQDAKGFPHGAHGSGKQCYFGECSNSAPPQRGNSSNVADEFTDFGVPPQPLLQKQIGSPTRTLVLSHLPRHLRTCADSSDALQKLMTETDHEAISKH